MSGLTAEPTGAPTPGALGRRLRHPIVSDAALVVGWFVVLGVIAAVVWWQLTPLAEYTRTATNAEMDEQQLGVQVSTDGWYLTIAAIGGLLSGIALLSLRRRDPVAMVLLVTLGSLLGGWLMIRVGLMLGPADPKDVLPHAAVGGKVPLQLKPHAVGVIYAWPITALLGAVGVVWGTDDSRRSARGEAAQQAGPEPQQEPAGSGPDEVLR
jgi:hypothetical protein